MAITKASSNAVAPAAKGDLIAGTTTNDSGVLAVGANGTVLTAASGQATGLEWATPSSGGMTLISTTTLSGASTTLSSIPQTYNSLMLVITGFTGNTADNQVRCYPNNVNNLCNYQRTTAATALNSNDSVIFLHGSTEPSRTDANNAFVIQFNNYTSSTSFKPFNYYGFVTATGPSNVSLNGGGAFRSNTAITSIVFDRGGTNTFAGGTVLLYGVK